MNEVEVCNLGLGRIGEGASRPIQSLTENSEAARACNRVFASAMRTTLRDFPWPFAQKSVALAEVTQIVPGYPHVYVYPDDCLFLHGLADEGWDPGRTPLWRHKPRILAASTGESRVIATDLDGAWAHYTMNITNPHFGDDSFQDALAWRIAIEVAIGLKADPALSRNASEQYSLAISHAAATAAREGAPNAMLDDAEDVRAYGGAVDPWEPGRLA